MEERLNKRDFAYILLCILLIAFALWFELTNYGKAFPEQTIKFNVDRKESKRIAEQFLEKINVGFSDYHHAVAFDYDNASKVFVEKEVGLEESSDLLNKEFRIWHWSNRWSPLPAVALPKGTVCSASRWWNEAHRSRALLVPQVFIPPFTTYSESERRPFDGGHVLHSLIGGLVYMALSFSPS